MAIEWTQEEIDTLRAAVASGILSVKYAGPPERVVVYQSLDAMKRLLADMVASAAETAGTRSRFRYAVTSKGL